MCLSHTYSLVAAKKRYFDTSLAPQLISAYRAGIEVSLE